jgi:HPt (histidine-containing phosphotransfer) domain-containing protein
MTDSGVPDVAAVNARMAELVRKFVARTSGEVEQMRAALAALSAGHGDDNGAGLTLIHQLAHRTCGTGGTLGLHSLADAAGAIEQLVEACPADTIPAATTRAQIAASIDRLAAQLALL